MESEAEKTKPRETEPAGVLVCRQGAAALRREVEEHSGGERGLVHLADAGEEVVSGFHDGCHYLARAIALQAVRVWPVRIRAVVATIWRWNGEKQAHHLRLRLCTARAERIVCGFAFEPRRFPTSHD